jgi:outer membrane protein assembly factor BamD
VHPKVDYAYFKSGLSYLKLSPKAIDRDQDYLDDAIANFEIVLRNFPDTAYLSVTKANLKDARTRLARRSFYIGKFYYRTGEYIAAIPRFQEVVDKYSDTGLAEEALYFMTIANMKMNKLEAAKENFSRLSLDHPQSKYLPKLQEKLIKKAEKQQKAEAL